MPSSPTRPAASGARAARPRPARRAGRPAPRGYLHLADHRYEVRDTQELIGRLVDEGVADRAPDRRHRRLLRRRPVARRSPPSRDRMMLPGRPARPLAHPRGTPAEAGGGRADHPLDRPDRHGRAQRPRADLRGRRRRPSAPPGRRSRAFARTRSSPPRSSPPAPASRSESRSSPGGRWASSPRPGSDPEADVIGWVSRAAAGRALRRPGGREIVRQLLRASTRPTT